jgi:hypothetical protein
MKTEKIYKKIPQNEPRYVGKLKTTSIYLGRCYL